MPIIDPTAEEYRQASHFWQTRTDALERKIATLQKELQEATLHKTIAEAQLAKVEELFLKLERKQAHGSAVPDSERKG